MDGEYISYFKNKNINEETYYKQGLIDGKRKTYWLNGSIKEISELKLEPSKENVFSIILTLILEKQYRSIIMEIEMEFG